MKYLRTLSNKSLPYNKSNNKFLPWKYDQTTYKYK